MHKATGNNVCHSSSPRMLPRAVAIRLRESAVLRQAQDGEQGRTIATAEALAALARRRQAGRLARLGKACLCVSLLFLVGMLIPGCARSPKGTGRPGVARPPRGKVEGENKPKRILASANSINSICLDGDAVWFCTDGGIVRYDAKTDSYRRYTKEDGLASNLAWAVSRQGDELWVGGFGGVSLLNTKSGAVQNWRNLNKARAFLVSAILSTSPGSASVVVEENAEWTGFAPAGLYRFERTKRTWTYQGPIEGDQASRLPNLSPEEDKFVQQAVGKDKLIEEISEAGKPFSYCTAVAEGGNVVWAGSPEGLYYRNRPSGSWRKASYEGDPAISALALDGEKLWVGTDDAGVFTFNIEEKETRAFGLPTDLPSNRIIDVVVRNDALWIAYEGGICRVSLPSLEVRTLAEDTDYPISQVRCMAGGEDEVYFAVPDQGVYSVDAKGKRFTRVVDLGALKTSETKDLAPEGSELWLSTERGLLRVGRDGSQTRLFATDEFLNVQEWEQVPILPVSGSCVLAAHGDSVLRLDPTTGNYLPEVTVDSGRGISGLCSAGEVVYICTQGGGLYSHRLGSGVANRIKGVGEFIASLAYDGQSLWLGNSEYEGATVGLQKLEPRSGSVQTFTLDDALPSEDILALAVGEGEVWVATSGGICRFAGR